MNGQTTETLRFRVTGMTCGGCVRDVRSVLSNVAGVIHAEVTVGKVAVTLDSNQANAREIETALTKSGFPTELEGDTK